MPSIHPSEDPPLGWLVPCHAVKDLEASLSFYAKLDFVRYGGDPAEGWAMLRSRAVEIHLFQGHIEKDLLNFRGGDTKAIRDVLTDRGLAVASEQGEFSFIYKDPDDREVFFDTGPAETAEYLSGQLLTAPFGDGDIHDGDGMDLGNLTCCLACADLAKTSAFYETLGLVPAGGDPKLGWSIFARRDHLPKPGTRMLTTYLSLFQDMIPADLLNFRGGDVAAIAEKLGEAGVDLQEGVREAPDGGRSLLIYDPDEHPLFFDTTPPERLALGSG